MGRFLVLRGGEDAERLEAALRLRDLDVAILPLQKIIALPVRCPPGPFAAVLATSAHAAPWLARHPSLHALPALAVGPRTGRALARAGFGQVQEGAGEALSLLPRARELMGANAAPILYAAGRVRRPETEAAFRAAGIALQTVEVYDARLRQPTEGELAVLTGGDGIAGVLLLSVAQGACFAAFAGALPPLRVLCLSERIRASLPAPLREDAETAGAPTLAALAERATAGQEARGSA